MSACSGSLLFTACTVVQAVVKATSQSNGKGQILSKSLKTRLRYCDFSIFQDGGRPPSWIGFTSVGTTHEEYLVVFVTVQNLVVIGAEISTVCKF